MSTQWLAIQSFQYDQDLLAAINTLSIHTKLELAGVADSERIEAAKQAREKLTSFFRELEVIVPLAEQGETTPLLGTTPRLRQLVKSFTAARGNSHQFRSVLFRDKLSHAQQLLYSDKPEDKQALVQCLEELRTLVEEHVDTDAAQIFGEV
jgi:hypothetical protein